MKIKNLKIYATEIALLTSAICTGCSLNSRPEEQNDKKITTTTTQMTTTTISNDNYQYDYSSDESSLDNDSSSSEATYNNEQQQMEKLTEREKALIENKKLVNVNFYKTKEIIDNIYFKCKYTELYEIDKAIETLNKSKKNKPTNTKSIIENGKINREKLIKSITENSEASISSDLINKVVEVISSEIDYYLSTEKIDIERLENNLEKLSVSDNTSFGYASYSASDQILSINPKVVTILAEQDNMSEEEVYTRLLSHEANHIMQAQTRDNIESNNYSEWYGICIKDDKLNVNSLSWDWYIDAAAEKMSMNKNKYTDPYTYTYSINALNGLKIATVFNGKQTNKLENLSMSSDINDFYKYFDCTDENSKRNIMELFYKLNLYCVNSFSSTSADFFKNYSTKHGDMMTTEEEQKYIYNVAVSICTEESKMFYNNLIETISNKEYKLEDILHLISIEETELTRKLKYNVREQEDDYKLFLDNYTNIQQSFFNELSIVYGIDENTIQEIYDKYYNDGSKNLSSFSEENNKLYLEIEKNVEKYKINSIHVLKEVYAKNNVKQL